MLTQLSDIASTERDNEIKRLKRERRALVKAVKTLRLDLQSALNARQLVRNQLSHLSGVPQIHNELSIGQLPESHTTESSTGSLSSRSRGSSVSSG